MKKILLLIIPILLLSSSFTVKADDINSEPKFGYTRFVELKIGYYAPSTDDRSIIKGVCSGVSNWDGVASSTSSCYPTSASLDIGFYEPIFLLTNVDNGSYYVDTYVYDEDTQSVKPYVITGLKSYSIVEFFETNAVTSTVNTYRVNNSSHLRCDFDSAGFLQTNLPTFSSLEKALAFYRDGIIDTVDNIEDLIPVVDDTSVVSPDGYIDSNNNLILNNRPSEYFIEVKTRWHSVDNVVFVNKGVDFSDWTVGKKVIKSYDSIYSDWVDLVSKKDFCNSNTLSFSKYRNTFLLLYNNSIVDYPITERNFTLDGSTIPDWALDGYYDLFRWNVDDFVSYCNRFDFYVRYYTISYDKYGKPLQYKVGSWTKFVSKLGDDIYSPDGGGSTVIPDVDPDDDNDDNSGGSDKNPDGSTPIPDVDSSDGFDVSVLWDLVGDVPKMFSQFFIWLPDWVITLLTFFCGFLIALGVKRLIF